MVLINKAINEVTVKLVYYGPGLCGKTTNLEKIYSNPKLENKGKMISMATETDRTLFFDFMPMELGTVGGQKVRVQLYTVPGQSSTTPHGSWCCAAPMASSSSPIRSPPCASRTCRAWRI